MSRRVHHPHDYHRVIVRTFICPVCGAVVPATKTQGITVAGHIKTMWCYSCREVRDFLQVDRVEGDEVMDKSCESCICGACSLRWTDECQRSADPPCDGCNRGNGAPVSCGSVTFGGEKKREEVKA